MYVAWLLVNGTKTELGHYNSPDKFRLDYPKANYKVIGRLIYTNDATIIFQRIKSKGE